ncbi:MAG: TolC family protein [Bacteroidales bacterium]|nr:TolC family protein [Bacteroidales bacterium]
MEDKGLQHSRKIMSMKTEQRIIRSLPGVFIVMLVFLFTMMVGCSPKTKTSTLPLDSTQSFSYSGTAEVPDRWWTVFDDQRLNDLVDTAFSANFNLKTAWQRLKAAQAVVRRENANLFPAVDASARSEMSRSIYEFADNNSFRLGLSAEYEVDLWGRINSRVEAEQYRANTTYTDYQTAALSLSAEIVRTWYQLSEARHQLDIVVKQIETNEKVLSLIKERFGSGQVRSVDIMRQRQLLEATREQRSYAEARVKTLEHQLAVLLGKPPQQTLEFAHDSLPQLPPLPETGIPVELIRRRPDVQSAYNLLKAADRDLAAAISDQYPRLSLSASVSTAAQNADNLFRDWAYSVAGNLLAPLIYGGRLSAEVDRNQAVKKQQLYQYGQAVLSAFREVEDALVREKKQRESLQSLKKQLALSRKAYEQLRVEYFNGIADYLDVLTALDEEQQLQRNVLSARLALLEYRIALYRALAGGFPTNRETVNEG